MKKILLLCLLLCNGCTTMNVTIYCDAGGNAEITTSIEQPKTVETSTTATIPLR